VYGALYLYDGIYNACKGIAMELLDHFFNYMTIMEVLNVASKYKLTQCYTQKNSSLLSQGKNSHA
jgi:hypothetical protein